MICCGYCSDFGKVWVLVRASIPDLDNIYIWHCFPPTKNLNKNLAFSMSEAALQYFPESCLVFFNFIILFYVGSGSKSGSGTGTIIHSGSGPAKAKSYGS
jgi:hypothetical protein